jgi:hypothetical protein
MFVQNFHEDHRNSLSSLLEKETWKKSNSDFGSVYAKLNAIPSLKALFQSSDEQSLGEDANSSRNSREG